MLPPKPYDQMTAAEQWCDQQYQKRLAEAENEKLLLMISGAVAAAVVIFVLLLQIPIFYDWVLDQLETLGSMIEASKRDSEDGEDGVLVEAEKESEGAKRCPCCRVRVPQQAVDTPCIGWRRRQFGVCGIYVKMTPWIVTPVRGLSLDRRYNRSIRTCDP